MSNLLETLPEGCRLLAILDAHGIKSNARPGPAAAVIASMYVGVGGLMPGEHERVAQATAAELGVPVEDVEAVVRALHVWIKDTLLESGILLPTDPALRAAAAAAAAALRSSLPLACGAS